MVGNKGHRILRLEQKDSPATFVGHLFVLFLKATLASIAGLVGLVVGSLVASALGFPVPSLPENIDTRLVGLLYIPVGVVIAVALGELFMKLEQKFFERFLCIWFFNFLVQHFLQILEQLIFTTMVDFGYSTVSNLFTSAFMSLVVATFWKPEKTSKSLSVELPVFVKRRKASDWAWRLLMAWFAYVLIYYLMGVTISPIVKGYYLDPTMNLGLVLPDLKVILEMQVIRGALYLLAVLPIIILWQKSAKLLWIWVGLAILAQVATLMALSYWLPLNLRLAHGVELTVDSFAQAYLYVRLLFVKK